METILKLLFLGHSLIAFNNWQGRFPDHDVVSLGVSGETVGEMLARIQYITCNYEPPDMIFLMSGLNDVAMGDKDFPDDYREAVKRLADGYPDAKIYINSILPTLTAFIPDSWIRNANESLEVIAADQGAAFLDIYRLFVDGKGIPVRQYLLDDEVHLSYKGYEAWSAELQRIIEEEKREDILK
jgi:lysophospholipase L1-like esterase